MWDVGNGFLLRERLSGFEHDKAKVKQIVITQDNMLYALGTNGNIYDIYRMCKTYESIYLDTLNVTDRKSVV